MDPETTSQEYETTGEEYWCVAKADKLASAFGLKHLEVDLPRWHDLMAGQGRAWEIIRRFYGVSALISPEPDDLREWTVEDLMAKYGISEELVKQEMDNAVKQWDIERAVSNVRQAAAAITDEDLNHLTRFSSGEGMTEEVITTLLKAFGFDHIQKDKELRAEVASRIISLKDWLNSPHTRTGARELIRTEIAMHSMDRLLIGYQNKLAKLQADATEEDDKASEIDQLFIKISSLEKQMRDMSRAHADKQEAIGANDLDMTARKRIYVETVTQLIDSCAEFERDPANWKPDGVFTAQEIDWMLEPSGDRGPQYRMDIALVANDAMKPENLWNPTYKPPKVTRRVCQELAQMYNQIRGIPADAEALPERDEDDEEEGTVTDDVMQVSIGEADASAAAPVSRAPVAQAAGFFASGEE